MIMYIEMGNMQQHHVWSQHKNEDNKAVGQKPQKVYFAHGAPSHKRLCSFRVPLLTFLGKKLTSSIGIRFLRSSLFISILVEKEK